MTDDEVLTWLLDSDPALRWQVERDLAGEPAEVWEATRARTATEGFGARLLALQDETIAPGSDRHLDQVLETPLGPEALARRLLRLAHDARTAEEE